MLETNSKPPPKKEHLKIENITNERILFEYDKKTFASNNILDINVIFEQSYKEGIIKKYWGGFNAKYELKVLDGYTGDILYSYKTAKFDLFTGKKIKLSKDYPECLEINIVGTAITHKTKKKIKLHAKDTIGC